MTMTYSPSRSADEAWKLVNGLQQRFADGLSRLADGKEFKRIEWLRDNGRCGGGHRLVAPDNSIFNRGSVNVSHVHYTGEADRKLDSATAISTIIHPLSPHYPSVHIHVSWTEMKSGQGYWRIMADLNPAIENSADKEAFASALKKAAGPWYEAGSKQGDRYFFIPALGRHRGVTHFYLEQHATADKAADLQLAKSVGESSIDTYITILGQWLQKNPEISPEDRAKQIDYHTLYLFQVLTLDRGTTSGLLVHSENDVGIMGSIPALVNRDLLASWESKVPDVNRALIRNLVACLPASGDVNDKEKAAMAQVTREHFKKHPEALDLQARGDTLPPTVANHQAARP